MSTPPEQGRIPIKSRGAPLKAAPLVSCAAAALIGAALWTNGAAAASDARGSAADARAAAADADGLYLDWMDRSVAPGADFFRFANGGWLKANPIPPDRSYWGVDSVLEQQNQTFIRDLMESLGRQDWAARTRAAQGGRFLRERHGRKGDRCRRREAPRSRSSRASRRSARAARYRGGDRASADDRSRRAAIARPDAGFQGQHAGDRGGQPERARAAESRLLLEERAHVQGGARRVRRARGADAGARGRCAGVCRARIEERDGIGDAARRCVDVGRRAAQSARDLPSHDARRARRH